MGWSAEEVSVSAREVEEKLIRDIMQHAGLTRPAYRYEKCGAHQSVGGVEKDWSLRRCDGDI